MRDTNYKNTLNLKINSNSHPCYNLIGQLNSRLSFYFTKYFNIPSQQGPESFFPPTQPYQPYGQPSIQRVLYRKTFLGGEAAGREVDHSPPPSAEVKNGWIHSFPSPFWCANGELYLYFTCKWKSVEE
jgi:hypothetical protein